MEVIKTTAAPLSDNTRQLLRAVDGYAVAISLADMRVKPLDARFVMCPWVLYRIEVQVA